MNVPHAAPGDEPVAPPARRFSARRLVKTLSREFEADRLTVVAGNIAFSGMLAIFPIMIAVISSYALFSDPQNVTRQLATLTSTLPGAARTLIYDQMLEIVTASEGKLGVGAVLGLATAIVGGSGGMHALIDGINRAYEERETRSYIRVRLLALGFTAFVVAFTVFSALVIGAAPDVLSSLGLSSISAQLLGLARWPALLVTAMAGLAALYRFAPSRQSKGFRSVSLGAAFACGVWLLASLGFAAYASYFGRFNETYGALAGAVVFMMWMYISTLAILIGAELNAELERSAASDARRMSS